MELIGAGLDGGIDDATGEVAELSRGVGSNDVEFLDGVGRRRDSQVIFGGLVVVHTVQNEVVGLLAMSIDVGTAAAVDVISVVQGGVIHGHAARRQKSQLDIVAGRQRNTGDGLGVDQGADLGSVGLQLRSFGAHLHGVGNRPHLHFESETCHLIEHQGDGRLDGSIKTRCLCLYFVGADGKIGEGKNATLSGLGGGGGTTLRVARRDCSVGKSRSRRIFDCASNAGCGLLS